MKPGEVHASPESLLLQKEVMAINSVSMTKYKDDNPLNTVTKIRNILKELGILTIETGWRNSAEGFYSVTVMIQNTNLSTNGKGTSHEYALASAYGELMERLQNFAHVRLSFDLREDALKSQGFFYAPDEKYISIDQLIVSADDWAVFQRNHMNTAVDLKWLLQKWQAVSYEQMPVDFVALPYFNPMTNRISNIPIKMISKMYMSNGMCGGNTPEEALVQGISETLERYVNKVIVLGRLTPPSIPREYLKKYPRIDAMIGQIETSGNFQVIVKDCSLNQGLPVTGVLFINRDDHTYFIKFGAHPIFEIAVERTLTELLQGQDVRSMMGVRAYSYKDTVKDKSKNLIDIFTNGNGEYPAAIFGPKPSYAWMVFPDRRGFDNRMMLRYLMETLSNLGCTLLVRDVSFLGFPTYHVIVPGLSEIEAFDQIKELDDYIAFNQIKRFLRGLDCISGQDVPTIADYLLNPDFDVDASMAQFLNLPLKSQPPWYYGNKNLFITALYCRIGDFTNAYRCFDDYLRWLQPSPVNKGLLAYYRCVRDYLGARLDNLGHDEISAMLSIFYPPDMVAGVFHEFGDERLIFNTHGRFRCWDCGLCELRRTCSYEAVERVYLTLKERYATSGIDQSKIMSLMAR